MTTLQEGNLQITFPQRASVRKFDDRSSHGLSHCMKAVDFIVEESDRILFIEFKDPGHPHAQEAKTQKFVDALLSGKLNDDLKYKYRDSFIYEWASNNVGKPIHYWVLVAVDDLTEAALLKQTEDLQRSLPLQGPASGAWTQAIAADCVIFNIATWNKHLPDFPIIRK